MIRIGIPKQHTPGIRIFDKFIKNQSRTNKLVICFGVDDKYVWPLLVTMYSGKKTNPEFKKCHIAFDPLELSSSNRIAIKRMAKIMGIQVQFVKISLAFNGFALGHISNSAFLRLSLPEKLNQNFLWLDSDLLLLQGWNSLFSELSVLIDDDKPISVRKHWPFGRSLQNRAIIESGDGYFNSGVLLVNIKKWNSMGLDQKALKTLEKYQEYNFEWADQCVLNFIIKNEYTRLNETFNTPPHEYDQARTKILHFAGSVKPWSYSLNMNGQIEGVPQFPLADLPETNQAEAFLLYRRFELELVEKLSLRGNH